MRYFIPLIFALATSSFAIAQNNTLRGVVTHKEEGIPGANIELKPGKKIATTQKDGSFIIEDLPEGNYTLIVSFVGFQSVEKTIEISPLNRNYEEISLKADILNLEQVVISATRSEIPMYKSPVIVSKLSPKLFSSTQSLVAAEGLNFTPGLRVENNCQNCGFTQVRMNGLDGPYSQILINSRPVFSALAGVYGLEMLPASMIDRVEVVRGGGSVMYGGNAIAGTINIITKEPTTNGFEVGINQAFTDFEMPDRTLSFNGSLVSDDLNQGISFYAFSRDRAPWDANDDGFSEITKLQNTSFGFDAFWHLSNRSKLKVGAYRITEFRRGGNAFNLAPHQTDVTEQLAHEILGANLSFEQSSKNLKHKINFYTAVQSVERKSYYGGGGRVISAGDSLSSDDILAINAYGKSNDISLNSGIQYVYDISKKWNLTLGSEFQINDVIDRMPGYARLIEQEVSVLGNYGQVQYKPNSKLTILAGGRLDNVNIKGNYELVEAHHNENRNLNVFVPRVQLMYEITKDLRFRAGYAQGYRAPQAFDEDLHIETVGGAARFIRLSTDLQTELSQSYTASMNYATYFGNTQVNFVAEGFYTLLENPFILSDQRELENGVAVITKRNGDGAIVQGLNLEANLALNSKLLFQSGFTIQSARFVEEEEIWAPEDDSDPTPAVVTSRLLRTPDNYGYFNLVYSPSDALSLAYSGVFTGNMDVAHVIDPETELTVIKRTPTFFEQNIKIEYNVVGNSKAIIKVFAGVQNIFNSFQSDFDIGPERDAGYVYGPVRPRSVFTGIKFGI